MATYDVTVGGTAAVAYVNGLPITKVSAEVDFSTINGGSGTAQNDIITAINVPAGTMVLGVAYEVVTASSNLADVDIGDGADPDGYHDGVNMTSTGSGFSFSTTLTEGTPNTVAGFGLGKYYAAADTIDLVHKTAATVTTGLIRVSAVMMAVLPIDV